jgi:GNAT superfamily N-acetyltransferase
MALEIRGARPEDLEVLARNNIATAMETEGRALDPQGAREGVRAVLLDPAKGFYLLAVRDGIPIGQCLVTSEWSDWRNGAFWWLQSVYVVPEERGRGAFKSLFRELVARSKRTEEVVGIRLYVERGNRLAHEVYSRLGLDGTRYIVFEDDYTLR